MICFFGGGQMLLVLMLFWPGVAKLILIKAFSHFANLSPKQANFQTVTLTKVDYVQTTECNTNAIFQ